MMFELGDDRTLRELPLHAGRWRLSKYHLPYTSDRVSRLTLQFGYFPKRNLWSLYLCF